MNGTLVDQDIALGRLDTDKAVHRLVRHLNLVTAKHHFGAANAHAGGRTEIELGALVEWPRRIEAPVVELLDLIERLKGIVPIETGMPAEGQVHFGADTGAVGDLGRRWIDHQTKGGAFGPIFHKRAQHACGVGITARTRIVLGIGNHDRTRRGFGQAHRFLHARIRIVDTARERFFETRNLIGNRIRRPFGRRFIPAVCED